ncbi:MAG: class I SAM-dependent methyltransferase [Oceanospirillaceae bacterium]
MSDWTSGYRADINYLYEYYPEFNPNRIRLALLKAGLQFPEVKTACELGFGQGLGLCINDIGSDVEWYGTDFNPSQASFAIELAKEFKDKQTYFDDSFEEFCSRDDLPDFDFIALHGIWTWISDENRHIIIDFIRRKLRPGGVVYWHAPTILDT